MWHSEEYYKMVDSLDSDILDTIVKAIPNMYMDVALGNIIYKHCVRRKAIGKTVTVRYIKWLRKEIMKGGE